MRLVELKTAVKYSRKRIEASKIDSESYVGTDNMLPNKRGVQSAKYTPVSGSVCRYDRGDILISNIRPYLKKIWYADRCGGSSADVLTLCINSNYNPRFIYYTILSNHFFEFMMSGSKGTKMPRGDKNQILLYKIPNFDILYQNKIAKVLSDLDAKIELNNKINNELEAMAKTLYDYWFVQFDFPNKYSKPYKTSGGEMDYNPELKREIPKGWEVENLKENRLTELIKPGLDIFKDEKIYLATADVDGNEINFKADKVSFAKRESRANMQPIENSIWFAKMKNTHKVLGFGEYSNNLINELVLSTGFAGHKCKNKVDFEYVWSFINNKNFETIKDRLSNGATQEAINNESMAFIPFIIPDSDILNKFHSSTYDLYQEIYINQTENQTLAELRDWLLPMLMNGQVEVGD